MAKEHCPRQRVICLITDAELDYDQRSKASGVFNTNVKVPKGEITIDMVAEACKAEDPIMKCRTCVLESCVKHRPAGPR